MSAPERTLTAVGLVVLALSALVLAAGCGEAAPMGDAPADEPDAAPPITCSEDDDLSADPDNCGACGRACVIPNASAGCAAGECVLAACAAGFADTDGELGNGCEADDDGGGGGCPVTGDLAIHRANGNGHLYTTDLAAAQTPPFSLEGQDYFRLVANPGPGLALVYLCLKGNGRYFLTASDVCEGGGSVVISIGHLSTEPACGTTPLYRLYSGFEGDHFYTVSEAERDGAVATFGYLLEGVAGHVWLAPPP